MATYKLLKQIENKDSMTIGEHFNTSNYVVTLCDWWNIPVYRLIEQWYIEVIEDKAYFLQEVRQIIDPGYMGTIEKILSKYKVTRI